MNVLFNFFLEAAQGPPHECMRCYSDAKRGEALCKKCQQEVGEDGRETRRKK